MSDKMALTLVMGAVEAASIAIKEECARIAKLVKERPSGATPDEILNPEVEKLTEDLSDMGVEILQMLVIKQAFDLVKAEAMFNSIL
jgi:hypothetical protein